MAYEWDPEKAEAHSRKHGVSFDEASSVFLDPNAVTYDDPDHSNGELREITIGFSARGRLLFVNHCWRINRLRIITARKATRKERKQYAEKAGLGES